MKKIGIIGGMGPESTVDYYRLIIDLYRKRKEKIGSPETVIYSLNFATISRIMESNNWSVLTDLLAGSVKSLHLAGADFALIASNTPHIVFEEVRDLSPIPMISIVEETCKVVRGLRLLRVGLLGTKTTMRTGYYEKVFSRQGIFIFVPDEDDQNYIHKKLHSELLFGHIIDKTRDRLLSIIDKMVKRQNIQGVILGCTELPLTLTRDEFGIPFLNTSKIHAESAVRYCLNED